jgi:hypothetical protein
MPVFMPTAFLGSGDALFESVKASHHFDGANGATTFPDLSRFRRTLAPSGMVALSTTQQKFGPTSLLFNGGAGDIATYGSSTDLVFGGDFCIEMFVKTSTFSTDGGARRLFHAAAATDLDLLLADASAAANLLSVRSGGVQIIVGTVAVADGSWHHIALDRSGSSLRLWVDGAQSGSTVTNSSSFNNNASNPIVIGAFDGVTGRLIGNIDELRITGASRYRAAFTAPASPFPDK